MIEIIDLPDGTARVDHYTSSGLVQTIYLSRYEAEKAMYGMSAIQEWYESGISMREKGREFISGSADGTEIWDANDLSQLVGNGVAMDDVVFTAKSGRPVTKAEILMIKGLWDSFQAWLVTPLYTNGPTPKRLLYRRE